MGSRNRGIAREARPILTIAVISMVLCGLAFPLLVTGISQAVLPYQANGEIVKFHGRDIGTLLIAQSFNLTSLFQPRNDSASGVDPEIPVQDALQQAARIHQATNISMAELTQIIDSNQQRTLWLYGDPYVNVLKLNLILIGDHPDVYPQFQ